MNIFQIKISLDNARPSIYRTILVKPNTSFYELHHIIQFAMGWENYHMYQFESGSFYIAEPDEYMEGESIDPNDILLHEVLKKPGDKVKYEYDFGDGWRHTIKLEKIIPLQLNKSYPTCIRGKRSCPPEDCGGIWGYENLKEIINNVKHPEHSEILEWLGGEFDPEYFNINEVNLFLNDLDFYLYDDFDDDFENKSIDDELVDLEDSTKEFQKQLLQIVNEQLDRNEPPETAVTFKRLLNADFSHMDAKMLIAQCVSYEVMRVLTEDKPFNLKRFITNLNKLPNTDF
jgi:hypothetical protein